MQKIEGKPVTLVMTTELIEEVEKISKRLGITKAQCMRNLMTVGCDIFNDFGRVGVWNFYDIFKEVKKMLKEKRNPQLF